MVLVTLYTPWHSITAHFGVAIPMIASMLVIIALISKFAGRDDFARKLTYPIKVFLLLSMVSIILACVGALIDFPASAFASSPLFSFKTTFAIITFFVYAGMYYTVTLKKEEIWNTKLSLAYVVALAVIGMFTVSTLGAVGGYLGKGHTVLEFVLRAFGLIS